MPIRSVLLLSLLASCVTPAWDDVRLVDLSHPFDERTIYWPTATPFELETVSHGFDAEGHWYAANRFSAAEHGGTHLDAPIHFAPDRWTVDAIPLERLSGPAVVIDVREACAADRDYRIWPADVLEHERLYGRIPEGAVVLFRTGWEARWNDRGAYLGSTEVGTAEDLHFPGLSAGAAQLLVDRRVDLVGLDTASLDPGPSVDFEAHRVLAQNNVPGLENVANLGRLPPRGARILALPMPIAGGTGAPCRIVAILPRPGEPTDRGGR